MDNYLIEAIANADCHTGQADENARIGEAVPVKSNTYQRSGDSQEQGLYGGGRGKDKG